MQINRIKLKDNNTHTEQEINKLLYDFITDQEEFYKNIKTLYVMEKTKGTSSEEIEREQRQYYVEKVFERVRSLTKNLKLFYELYSLDDYSKDKKQEIMDEIYEKVHEYKVLLSTLYNDTYDLSEYFEPCHKRLGIDEYLTKYSKLVEDYGEQNEKQKEKLRQAYEEYKATHTKHPTIKNAVAL